MSKVLVFDTAQVLTLAPGESLVVTAQESNTRQAQPPVDKVLFRTYVMSRGANSLGASRYAVVIRENKSSCGCEDFLFGKDGKTDCYHIQVARRRGH